MKHVYGWLLLTPAAILLIGFTHYPAAATLFDSFFSTGTRKASAMALRSAVCGAGVYGRAGDGACELGGLLRPSDLTEATFNTLPLAARSASSPGTLHPLS